MFVWFFKKFSTETVTSFVNKSVYFYLPSYFLPPLLSLFFLLFPFPPLPSALLSLSLSFFYYTRISLSHTWWEQVGKVWVSYYSVWCQLCIFCSYSLLVLRKLSSILLSFFLMNYFHLHHFFFIHLLILSHDFPFLVCCCDRVN